MIDTHSHIDGEEFAQDLPEVIARAKAAGIEKVFVPAIDLKGLPRLFQICRAFEGFACPMVGLHPEEVRADWREVLAEMRSFVVPPVAGAGERENVQPRPLAIGEVGLDFYWSREFEQEQLAAFEEQVRWSVETRLPLMIHCRKAQNELVGILKKYARELPGGVFHCFTGNETEARQLLEFPNFVLGIGGVLTFKKSKLPETLGPQSCVPLSRIVLETDAPYMAPVPYRGQRNEPAYVREVALRLAEVYGVTLDEISRQTDANVARVFSLAE
ncbi:MAG: TatD family hydrolase [Prevotella sp.]|nr:TatD family hydrolase [Prevotella sp.]